MANTSLTTPTALAAHWATAVWPLVQAGLALPFDVLRHQRARAVQAGWLDNSMLASRDFERTLTALEQWALGPCARRA